MNFTKQFLVLTSILTVLVLSLAAVSAFSVSTPSTFTLHNNQTTFTVTNDDSVTENISFTISPITSGSNQVNFAVSAFGNLTASSSKAVPITASFVGTMPFGTYTTTLSTRAIDASTGSLIGNSNVTVTFLKSFCKNGQTTDDLSIDRVKVRSDGSDDLIWKPLNKITVEMKVSNNGDNSAKSMTYELGLFDSNGRNVVNDLTFSNSGDEKIDVGTISDGSSDTETFEFTVPADFSDGTYRLSVKAYSTSTGGEANTCVDTSGDLEQNFFTEISAEKESNKGKRIAFDNVHLNSNTATCGDIVTLSSDVFNVGDTDEDQVKVDLVNTELGINMYSELKQGLDQGDNRPVSFTFTVPQNAKDKTYQLGLSSEYNYKDGLYRQASSTVQTVALQVIGCTIQNNQNNQSSGSTHVAGISASLDSDAKAGQDMSVTVSITNLKSTQSDFVIDASGYSSWATLKSVSSKILTLAPGQTKTVTMVFAVNSDAQGENTFNIVASSGTQFDSREVAVNLAEKTSNDSFSLGNDTLIWIIGAVNLILIIVIIIVAVRISRKD